MDPRYHISPVTTQDLASSGALELVWRVFCEFEAPEYADEGIKEFKDFIAADSMLSMMRSGQLRLWGCFERDFIVGVLAIRPPTHISLLFVDRAHHRRGIARMLYKTALESIRRAIPAPFAVTVHSSPYAVEAYRALGFTPVGPEQTVNGLRFVPMSHPIEP